MKRIGVVLSILLVCFFIKFSNENLGSGVFFVKIGCISDSKEYALFVEGGSKPAAISSKPSPRIASYEPPIVLKPEPAPALIVQSAPIAKHKEDDAEDREFALAVDQLEIAYLEQNRDLEQLEKKRLEESVSFLDAPLEASQEPDLQIELGFSDLPIPNILPEPNSFSEIAHVEIDEPQFESLIPNTDQEFAAAEVDARGVERIIEIEPLKEVYIQGMAFGELNFGEKLTIYGQMPPQKTTLVVHEGYIEPEIELVDLMEAPSTAQELAAAEVDARGFERPIEIAPLKEASIELMAFGEADLEEDLAPYGQMLTQEPIFAAQAPFVEPEIELIDLLETPNTEQEFAAAEIDARGLERPIEIAPWKESNIEGMAFGEAGLEEGIALYGQMLPQKPTFVVHENFIEPEIELVELLETPNTEQEFAAAEIDARGLERPIEIAPWKESNIEGMAFGEAGLEESLAPYGQMPTQEPIFAAQAPFVEPEIELIDLLEIPNTEQEFAAAEIDARGLERPIEIAPWKESNIEGMAFGETGLEEGISLYGQMLPQKPTFVVHENFIEPEIEVVELLETPNTEQEFAAAEIDARGLERPIEIAPWKESNIEGMAFGEAGLEESLAPYGQMPTQELIFAAQAPFIEPEVELVDLLETPNTESEFAAAELDARRVELPIEIEQFKETNIEGMAFGDAKIEEKVSPYAEIALPEVRFAVSEFDPKIELVQIEVGEFAEVPNTEKELAAAELDARRVELPIEIEQFKETNIEGMAFGDAKIEEKVSPYAEIALPEVRFAVSEFDPKIELVQIEVGEFAEVPNTEKELAAAELDARRVELPIEIEQFKETNIEGMAFGDAKIEEKVSPYTEIALPEAKFAVSEFDPKIELVQIEVGEFAEVPNTEKELATAELDARRVELPIEIEQLKETKIEGMAFGDTKMAEKVSPYAEIALPESKVAVKELNPKIELAQVEVGEFVEPPNTEKEYAAAESDVKKRELPIEKAVGQIEEIKEEKPMAFGEPELKEAVPPYPEPQKEIAAHLVPPAPNDCTFLGLCASFLPKRLSAKHIEGWGDDLSIGTDFTTIELMFATDYRQGHVMPMLDLKFHQFDNITYAAGVGVGGRYIPTPNSFCELFGFNAYYDYRQGGIGNYNQVGVGIEALGKRWDFRANGYFPVGLKKNKVYCSWNYDEGYYATQSDCEFTSYGYNVEVGYRAIRSKDFSLYFAGGAFYLVKRCCSSTRGWMARVQPMYKDIFAVQFTASYDSVFKVVYQAEVSVNVPLYQFCSKKESCRPCRYYEREIYQPVVRFDVMPIGRQSCWTYNW